MPAQAHMAIRPAIVIPALNESGTIRAVIEEILTKCAYPIFVVDDASTDATASMAQTAGATVIPLVNRMGAWGATQAGLRYARRRGHNVVISMDADGQHDPGFINSLIEPIRAGEADVCIGSCTERGSVMRHIAWKVLRNTSGIRIEDLTSGFRAYNEKAIEELASWRATFLDYQDVGVLALLISRGMHIVDTRTEMRARRSGHSRVFRSWLIVTYYMCHTMLLGLTKRPIRRYRPMRTIVPDAP